MRLVNFLVVRVGLAREPGRNGNQRKRPRFEFFQRPAPAINLLRLQPVAVRQENVRRRQVPAPVGHQRQKKRADKLRVRFPDRVARIAAFERQRVNEHRLAAAKQNVMRGGVLQPETVRERGLGEFERQTAGVPEHFGRPFVRIARKGNALVLKDRADGLRGENRSAIPAIARSAAVSSSFRRRVETNFFPAMNWRAQLVCRKSSNSEMASVVTKRNTRPERNNNSPPDRETMVRMRASPGINFRLPLWADEFQMLINRRFLAAPKHFPKQPDDPPACFFQIEQEADKCRDDGLPESAPRSGVNISIMQ